MWTQNSPRIRTYFELATYTSYGQGCCNERPNVMVMVFDLLEGVETLKHLPRTPSAIKTYVKARLPPVKLRRQEVTITPQKQPTGGVKSAGRANKEGVYHFDPVHLF